MKTISFAIVLMLVCVCGCSTHFVSNQEASGTVTISFFLNKSPANGNNQVAVWIEDEDGNYIKSLLVTPFAADGG